MPSPLPAPDEVLTALRAFVDRIDPLDPDAPPLGELTVRLDGQEERLTLRGPVGRALIEALGAHHDPRDQGPCEHCGGRRLDDNFLCRDCGRPNGVFGQLLAERAARYTAPLPLPAFPGEDDHADSHG